MVRCYTRPVSGSCVVGVDLGGTNVRARAFHSDGSPAGERFQNSSRAQDGVDATVGAIVEVVRCAIDGCGAAVQAVGLALPGHIDDERGLVRWAPNFGRTVDGIFRNWVDVPIKAPLEAALGVPVRMDNDANLAALGEYRFGLGRNSARCLVMLTLGTGVGGGVVMAPSSLVGDVRGPVVLVGGNKGGAELGHLVVQHGGLDCNAGSYGALEAYCQRDAIVRRAVHRLKRGRSSLVVDSVAGDWSRVTPRILAEAAHEGDELALEVWAEVGTALGVGIGVCINIFAPDIVAIGGQIAQVGEPLFGPARAAARNVAIPSLFADARIERAEQLEDAGLLGGAALALGSAR